MKTTKPGIRPEVQMGTRPHPGPLPLERENRSQRIGEASVFSGSLDFCEDNQRNGDGETSIGICRSSESGRPLLGERAGVRADQPFTSLGFDDAANKAANKPITRSADFSPRVGCAATRKRTKVRAPFRRPRACRFLHRVFAHHASRITLSPYP